MSNENNEVQWHLGSKSDGSELTRWSCANTTQNGSSFPACTKVGVSLCSKCRLVKYCSKQCQTAHWKHHKSECNSPYAHAEWVPSWLAEQRKATYINSDGGPKHVPYSHRAMDQNVWANIPAFDCFNGHLNEGATAKDKDLAFLFAGPFDLGDIIKTVNNLPTDYSGTCTININSRSPYIAIRNLVSLCMLAEDPGPPVEEVAEAVLHLTYSAAITPSQAFHLCRWVAKLFGNAEPSDGSLFISELAPVRGSTGVAYRYHAAVVLLAVSLADATYTWKDAKRSMDSIRLAPSRTDYRERRMSQLLPRQRVALHRWLTTGILLPYGESVEQFTEPNRFMFNESGVWLSADNAILTDGWDPIEVEAYRKQKGLPVEDLYGSYFFYIKDQYAEFTRRLRRFTLNFKLTFSTPPSLSEELRSSQVRFDRIYASNLMNTGGPASVITWFGPLLNKSNRHSTLLMYSRNWAVKSKGVDVEDQGQDSTEKAMMKVARLFDPKKREGTPLAAIPLMPGTLSQNLNAFNDTERAFLRYLAKNGVDDACKAVGLRRREKPRVHPARFGVPMSQTGGEVRLGVEEFHLLNVQGGVTWTERFVEFETIDRRRA